MDKYVRFFLPLMMVALLSIATWPAHAQQVALTSIEVSENGEELLNFNLNSQVALRKTLQLSQPDRLVIDISRIERATLSIPKGYSGKLVKQLRFGQFDSATSRIVIDLHRPVVLLDAQASGTSAVVKIAPSGEVAATAAPNKSSKPLIIIDAGHGGQDPGAIGIHKTREKDITLNYAKALRDALLATGRYRVTLTREDDRFILLHERVALARKHQGDLFISLHADSNPRAEARGFSIYTLSETASDDEAAALADRENKSDIIPGIDLSTADPDVASILIDLTQRETMNKSAQLADAIVAALPPSIRKLERPHRYAGFRVLKAPDIPSVLIELGFLTNAEDERLLLTKEHRARLVKSVVAGIDRYLK